MIFSVIVSLFRYRFVELYYRRVESVRKGRVIPARTQTVVIFLPDVRSCLPTRLEWDELSVKYKKHLEMKLQTGNSSSGRESMDTDKKSHSKLTEIMNDDSNAEGEVADKSRKSEAVTATTVTNDGDSDDQKEAASSESKTSNSESNVASSAAAISKALH